MSFISPLQHNTAYIDVEVFRPAIKLAIVDGGLSLTILKNFDAISPVPLPDKL